MTNKLGALKPDDLVRGEFTLCYDNFGDHFDRSEDVLKYKHLAPWIAMRLKDVQNWQFGNDDEAITDFAEATAVISNGDMWYSVEVNERYRDHHKISVTPFREWEPTVKGEPS